MEIQLCARCAVDAKAFDREHRHLARSNIAKYIFCRRCAELLKRRLEKEANSL